MEQTAWCEAVGRIGYLSRNQPGRSERANQRCCLLGYSELLKRHTMPTVRTELIANYAELQQRIRELRREEPERLVFRGQTQLRRGTLIPSLRRRSAADMFRAQRRMPEKSAISVSLKDAWSSQGALVIRSSRLSVTHELFGAMTLGTPFCASSKYPETPFEPPKPTRCAFAGDLGISRWNRSPCPFDLDNQDAYALLQFRQARN